MLSLERADRATNLIRGTKYEQYLQVRADIKDFRDKNKLDKIIVLWTANTERFCEVRAGVHDTSENIERALRDNNSEISPSTIFALAAIDENTQNNNLWITQRVAPCGNRTRYAAAGYPATAPTVQSNFEPVLYTVLASLKEPSDYHGARFRAADLTGLPSLRLEAEEGTGWFLCIYINGSPQNTLVGGVVERAEMRGVFVAGDDFKSGQTKLKSVLVDFLVSAGLKPVSIVSYNHLGNNDGKNLSAPKQFRSKEITKSNVVDDMVESNQVLYKPGEKPDHVVVIKYVPYVGDSKRAMDEYTSEILLHGTNTIVVHNTCEDSLLAVPLILDLVLLADLFSRFAFRETDNSYVRLHAVLSPLAYLLKAPLVASGAPVVNALFKQRANIDNLLRAALALPPNNNLGLEHKVPFLMKELHSGALFNSPPNKKQKLTHENGDQ
ncbi:hypothetical protein SFRURICE_018373 [Spodoptera frugiperda]|nr:hypothetical protein SFRURICE_018373 [Spodoptera frugiperda]